MIISLIVAGAIIALISAGLMIYAEKADKCVPHYVGMCGLGLAVGAVFAAFALPAGASVTAVLLVPAVLIGYALLLAKVHAG